MKRITYFLFFIAAIIAAPSTSASPDLTDLLKGAASSLGNGSNSDTNSGSNDVLSGIQGLVEGLISKSNLTEADLVGNYQYSAPAVAFQSSNLLQKAGGAAASGVITSKLAPYYEKVGIDQLTATFNEDKTFKFTIKKVKLTGTFEKDTESENGDFIFKFNAGGKIPLGSFKSHVEKVGSKMTITFDASKLITLVNTIASISGQSTLKSVASMLNSYDGLNCGFELTPVK
ncbi:MAG: DUF4923 family protein [Bacteroidales bacterium]|nr:DUF4923 family protein [Bacteroidales bacterium]